MLVCVFTCQNTRFLEITRHGSFYCSLGPASYDDLSHTRENTPAYDNIGETTRADHDSR